VPTCLRDADELAKLLWRKTSEPLRAAVVACRVCKWLEDEMGADRAFSSPLLVRRPPAASRCSLDSNVQFQALTLVVP
jgi:hypothetical protein